MRLSEIRFNVIFNMIDFPDKMFYMIAWMEPTSREPTREPTTGGFDGDVDPMICEHIYSLRKGTPWPVWYLKNFRFEGFGDERGLVCLDKNGDDDRIPLVTFWRGIDKSE